jgi:hypothetical protein
MARPACIGASGFSFHGSGELSRIGLIVESEVHLWRPVFPDQRCRVISRRTLLNHKPIEQHLGFLRIVTAKGPVVRNYRTHNEMGSRLAGFKLVPGHSGHWRGLRFRTSKGIALIISPKRISPRQEAWLFLWKGPQ